MFNLILAILWFILGLICLVVIIREHEKKKGLERFFYIFGGLVFLANGVYQLLEFL